MLVTLGELSLTSGEVTRPKPLLLLAYLCLEGGTTRQQLRELFFGYGPGAAGGLRVALAHLRTTQTPCIVTQGDRVAAHPDLYSDAGQLLTLAQQGDHTAVLSRYRGRFVDGLPLTLTGELEEWVLTTRERLATVAARSALHLAEAAGAGGRTTAEVKRLTELAARWSDDEGVQEWLGRLSGSSGPATALPWSAPTWPGLPALDRPCYGRAAEEAQLLDLLRHQRLLTLTGPGGTGKTCLSRKVSLQLLNGQPESTYPAGHPTPGPRRVAWVALHAGGGTAARSAGQTSAQRQLHHALGLDGHPPERLLTLLREQPTVLVLDTSGPDPAVSELVRHLLSECPELHLLVTARQPLGLDQETVLPLYGFALPDGPLPADHPARRMLLDDAPAWEVPSTPEEGTALDALARLLAASPLALRLAGAALRVSAPSAVLRAAEHRLEALGPELRAVWTAAAEQLTPRQRQVAWALALFPGRIEWTAASQIAGATLTDLSRLRDLALLRQDQEGQAHWHPLLRPFALEAEQALDERPVRDAHAQHFLELWLAHPDRASRIRLAQADWPHLAQALQHAAEGHWPMLEQVTTELAPVLERAGRLAEGLSLLRQLAPHLLLQTDLHAATAWLAFRLGMAEDAQRQAHDVIHSFGASPEARASAHNTLGSLALHQGNARLAAIHFQAAVDGAGGAGQADISATYLGNLAASLAAQGEMRAAEQLYREALHRLAGLDDPVRQITLLSSWAHLQLFYLSADPTPVALWLEEGLEALDRAALPSMGCAAWVYLGYARLELGDAPAAQAAALRAHALAVRQERVPWQVAALLLEGRALAHQQQWAGARARLGEGVSLARTGQDQPQMIEGLVFCAECEALMSGTGVAWASTIPGDTSAPAVQRVLARATGQGRTPPPLAALLALAALDIKARPLPTADQTGRAETPGLLPQPEEEASSLLPH